MSRVDVVVPCYKYAHYLRQCVESVLGQSHGDLRVLIVDDCSPDHTEDVARGLVAEDRRVAYRRHEVNRGHIATYNEGLDWADGDYVLLLSADDLLAPGAVERAVELLDAHPQAGFVHGCQLQFETDRPLPPARSAGDSSSWEVSKGHEFLERCCEGGDNPVATPTAIVRVPLLRRVGGYNADLPHTADLDLWLRLAVRGSVAWLDADQAYKRVHAANMQFQYARSILEIQQRRAAFEAALGCCGDPVDGRDRLLGIVKRVLGSRAFWAASAAFDEGDVSGCQQLLTLALDLDPGLALQPRWTRLALKRGLGPHVWAVLRPLAELLRSPFRSARTVG